MATLKARGSTLRYEREDAPIIEGQPESPPWMPKEAEPFWTYILSVVHPSVLARQDGPHIAELAVELMKRGTYEKYLASVPNDGLVMAQSGIMYDHPFIGRRNKCSARIDKLFAKLGMNPADRSTVAPVAAANKGKIGKFIGVA